MEEDHDGAEALQLASQKLLRAICGEPGERRAGDFIEAGLTLSECRQAVDYERSRIETVEPAKWRGNFGMAITDAKSHITARRMVRIWQIVADMVGHGLDEFECDIPPTGGRQAGECLAPR